MEGTNILEIVLKARDEASQAIKNMGDNVDAVAKKTQSMSATFKEAGVIMIGAGLAGAAVMKTWLDQAVQAQTTVIKTNTLLQAEADQMHTNFGTMQKASEDAGRRLLGLGFDAEQSALSFAILLGPTKDVKTANEALSTAADLARFKNISLEDATTAVTRAYEGNTRALKALGIEVPKGAQGLEVLSALHQRLAGQADNFANSYAGMSERLKASFQELQVRLGTALLPVFDKFVGLIEQVIKWFNSLSPSMVSIIAKVTLFGTAFALIAGPILLFIGFISAIINGFVAIAAVALPLTLVLGAVALVGFLIYTHWKQVVTAFQSFMPVINSVTASIQKFIKDNRETFIAFFIVLQGIITFALGFIKGVWQTTWQAMADFLMAIWEVIKGIVQVAWGFIEVLVYVGLAIFTGNWQKAWEGIKKGVNDIWEGIKSIVTGAVQAIIDAVKLMLDSVIGFINGIISGANAVIDKIPGSKGVKIPLIPKFEMGGYVPSTGLAVLHEGEYVLSKDMIAGRQPVSIPGSNTTNYKQPITIYATINEQLDLNLLGHKIAFALRNSR